MENLLFRIYGKYLALMSGIRRRINKNYYTWLNKRTVAFCKGDVKVNAPTYLTPNTYLGHNVNFNGMKIIGKGKVIIGDNFHSGIGCRIITVNHNYNGEKIPYDATNIVMNVTIEDNVWLGEYVTIVGNVTIGEGAIIQAQSVVVSDIPKLGIAGGHPAKVFRYRDKDKYFLLKAQGKFH